MATRRCEWWGKRLRQGICGNTRWQLLTTRLKSSICGFPMMQMLSSKSVYGSL